MVYDDSMFSCSHPVIPWNKVFFIVSTRRDQGWLIFSFQVGRQPALLSLLSGRSDGCALHCVSLPNHLLIQDDGEHDVWVSVDATFVLIWKNVSFNFRSLSTQ